MRKFNWQLWFGLLLTIFAFLSYPFIFVWFPATRDSPWANLALFAVALVALALGIRRAWMNKENSAHPLRRKIVSGLVASFCVLILAVFIFVAFIRATWLPASKGAPQVGQKAPEFTLTDTSGRAVSLTELRSTPANGKAVKGVLLIFYRGYW